MSGNGRVCGIIEIGGDLWLSALGEQGDAKEKDGAMKQTIKLANLSGALVALTACAPLPTKMPPSNYIVPDTYHQVVTPEREIGKINQQLLAFEATWRNAHASLAEGGFWAGEGVFYGSIAAAIGGLTKSVATTKAGAGIAGGSALLSDHYKVTVQATNYLNAADAIRCLRLKIAHVPSGVWTLYDNSGALIADKSYFSDDQAAIDGYKALSDLISTIDESIFGVVSALTKAQGQITLASPSVADITKAISASVDAKPKTQQSAAAVTSVVTTNSVDLQSIAKIPNLESAIASALELPTELQTCVAAFGK